MGDYWGSVTIGYNGNLVKNPPKTFADLLKPEYKNQVALNGSPLTSGSAIAGVSRPRSRTAARSATSRPGVDWFAKCKSVGNFIPVQTVPQTVASGQTPISIDWDYNNFAYVKEFPSANWKVTIPSDGQYGGHYAQAVNATAPHPWAARSVGGVHLLRPGADPLSEGFAHPARFANLVARKVIPKRSRRRSRPGGSTPRRSSRAWDNRRPRKWSSLPVAREGRRLALATHVAHGTLRPGPAPGRRRPSLAWLGVVPFFAYATCSSPAGR